MDTIKLISLVLVIVGGLNWGAIGAFKTDFVSQVAGQYAHYIFIAVGLASVVLIAFHFTHKYEHIVRKDNKAYGVNSILKNINDVNQGMHVPAGAAGRPL
jgi:uncharacterized membrane protein YuzA (DUF378 family)